MESEREQLMYGGHCKHGTAIGTAGGADFMCHMCEMGEDTWVDDTGYALWFRFSDQPLIHDDNLGWTKIAEWWDSIGAPDWAEIRPNRRSMRAWLDLFNDPAITKETMLMVQHKVTVTREGYWSE